MKTQLDNINFTSKIKLISMSSFNDKTKCLKPKIHEVGYPWNADTMKKGKKLFTTQILDCIAGGIIDNNSITMFHQCILNQKNAKKYRQQGFSISKLERRILEKIDLTKENLHAFILGGFQLEDNSKYNVRQLEKIKQIFEKLNIPYSIFAARRDVHFFGKFAAYYDNKEDTLYLSNSLTNSYILKEGKMDFELEINDKNVIYHTYTPNSPYIRKKHKGTAEDFLKSQFRQVKLSKFDEFE